MNLRLINIYPPFITLHLCRRMLGLNQRGLKYTEHKPRGRHYLGATYTTMSFAVRTVILVKGGVRARICIQLWSPGIDSEESISPAHVAWRASTTNRVAYRPDSLGLDFWAPWRVYKYGLSIMAMDVYNCCWSYRFISQPGYSWRSMSYVTHLSSLWRNLLTLPYISVHSLYSDFTV